MALYDYDGSASLTGKPTIITTRHSFWNVTNDCIYDSNQFLWYCPWYEQNNGTTWEWNTNSFNIAYFDLDIPGLTEGSSINGLLSSGYFSQFGNNLSVPYGFYPGIAGMSNRGWYFRSVFGAPDYLPALGQCLKC